VDTDSVSTQLASSPLLLAGGRSFTTSVTHVTTPTLTLFPPTVTMVLSRVPLAITFATVMLCLVVLLA